MMMTMIMMMMNCILEIDVFRHHRLAYPMLRPLHTSGGATPGRARSNDLAGRSTTLAPPCLPLYFASV